MGKEGKEGKDGKEESKSKKGKEEKEGKDGKEDSKSKKGKEEKEGKDGKEESKSRKGKEEKEGKGKKREDRAEAEKSAFDPLTIEISNLPTVLLLLQSPDESVITQALASLDKFAIKGTSNLSALWDQEALFTLLPLVESDQYPIRRYALKVIAEMSILPEVKEKLLEEPENVTFFVDVFNRESDLPMQEFSSAILAELTKLHIGCAYVLENDLVDNLFPRLESVDPDISYNVLRIMKSLLNDPEAAAQFVKSENFQFPAIIRLLDSEYPDIQLTALGVLDFLTRRRQDETIQEKFRECQGFNDLLDILEVSAGAQECISKLQKQLVMEPQVHEIKQREIQYKYFGIILCNEIKMFEWKDLHEATLAVLGNIADCPETVDLMNGCGDVKRLISYMDNIHDPNLIELALNVVAKMAGNEVGRKVLTENQCVEALVEFLHDDNPGVLKAAALGISKIVAHRNACEILVKENPIKELVSILSTEQRAMEVRQAAALALSALLRADKRFGEALLSLHLQTVLYDILKKGEEGDICIELLTTIFDCLEALALCEDNRLKTLESGVVDAILPYFESLDPELQIAAIVCLSAYVKEEQVNKNFLASGGVPKLINCLKDTNIPLRRAAVSLLQLLVSDPMMTDAFLKEDLLQWMMDEKPMRNICPAWETAIETIFKNCLPAKFFYTKRLDLEDVTGDMFYLFRKTRMKFVFLESMIASEMVPLDLVYTVNLTRPHRRSLDSIPEESEIDGSREYSSMSVRKSSVGRSSGRKSSTGWGSVRGSGSEQSPRRRSRTKSGSLAEGDAGRPSFHEFPEDKYLATFVEELKKLLKNETEEDEDELNEEGEGEYETSETMMMKQINLLANFVDQQMCGPTEGVPCTNHRYEVHINELKRTLGSTLIPLGHIRVGMHFERAALFKILADQIGLPCALARGEYGRSWVEVAIPKGDPPDESHAIKLDNLPTRLLRPNHIVDLMDEPGRLHRIGSLEAKKYMALPTADI